jgi:septum formation protein
MLYLASCSPRRAELLRQIGIEFDIIDGEIDETARLGETPAQLVSRLSIEKAYAGRDKLGALAADDWVLASDTMIAIDDTIIGKPQSSEDCRKILQQLSARQHEVYSAVALVGAEGDAQHALSVNRIKFRTIRADEIAGYCASEEPMDKAGAYAIQGRAAVFIERLEGSYSAVMGLPLYETEQLLHQVGFRVFRQGQNE